jgi:ABC-type multidrug transport system, ATPase component
MDPDTADIIRRHLIRYQKDTEATIILASHNMSEIEQLCQNVLIMKKGEIVAQGPPANLVTDFQRQNLEQVFLDIARSDGAK